MVRYSSALTVDAFNAAAPGPRSLSDISYTRPRGWNERQVNDLQMVLKSPGTAGDAVASIIVALCPELPGDFAAQFQTAVSSVLRGKQIVEASAVSQGASSHNIDRLCQRLVVSQPSGRRVATAFTGLRAGDGLLLVGILASDVSQPSAHEASFAAFLDSFRIPPSAPA